MRRLFWVGVGAVGAVVAARRLEHTVRRYTPAGVADQVQDVSRRTGTTARGALARFQQARTEREQDLVTRLLVTPEGGDPAALRRGRRRDEAAWDDDELGAPRATHRAGRPSGRVDDDEPLYDF